MPETLLAPGDTTAEVAEPDSIVDEVPVIDEVETDDGEQSEENEGEATTPVDPLESLSDDELRNHPKTAKLLEEAERRVRQSESDKAKFAIATQQAEQARSQASTENRTIQAQMAVSVAQKLLEEGRQPTMQDFESILRAADAHSHTVGTMQIASDLTKMMADNFPDYRPDANDSQAFQYARDTFDASGMARTVFNVAQKAMAAKAAVDEQKIRLDERNKVLAERSELATKEAGVKAAKKQAEERNDPAKQATRVNGTGGGATRFKTAAEFNLAFMNGTVKAPLNVPLASWIASQTKGLPAR